jgi:pimeloyl-ACP methyl ester carboxylesterase
MPRRALRILFALLTVATSASAQSAAWKDPSSHATRFVTVADGVELEVLDWGGSGPALVLLAGLGDTGHAFDDFAPMLTMRYRVVALTRRGHGSSSAPSTGYEFGRLAEDVVEVIDAMELNRPIVVGHSFAGEEMHVLGARYPMKIAGLVYVDAAFDRGDDSDNAAYDSVARTLPPAPRRTPADLASFTALRSYLERTQGFASPEAYLRTRYIGNPDGTVAGPWAPVASIRQALSAEMRANYRSYSPERIRVPALAMYAVPKEAADLMRPWYGANDRAVRQSVERLFPLTRARFEGHARWFKAFAEQPSIVEIAGAHHLFFSNPREVLQHVDAFVSSLGANR